MPTRRKNRSTRADVARLASVSPAVVSYVINGGPRPVSPEARERVEQAIAALGYRPNETARALVRGRSHHVGLVAVDTTGPFYSELAAAIDRELFLRGLTLVTASSTYRPPRDDSSPLELLLEHNVTAALMATQVEPSDIAFARAHDLPIVALNERKHREGLSSALVDYAKATKQAVSHLIDHGRRHIGFVGGFYSRDARHPAWLETLAAADLAHGPSVQSDWTPEAGYEAGRWIVEQQFGRDELDALFIASDAIALGCLAALNEAGLRVPEDIAVVSFDGTKLAPFIGPGLTTMAQPIERIAKDVVSLLLDPERLPGTHLSYEAKMVVRRSCGCTPN
ncbi:MAG: LacI family DNA-binding transcriptional regulator [Tessaracoccus sp.]